MDRTATAAREGQVVRAHSQLTTASAQLQEVTRALQSRLQSVLRPSPVTGSGEQKAVPEEVLCPVAQAITDRTKEIREQTQVLNEILQLLEV